MHSLIFLPPTSAVNDEAHREACCVHPWMTIQRPLTITKVQPIVTIDFKEDFSYYSDYQIKDSGRSRCFLCLSRHDALRCKGIFVLTFAWCHNIFFKVKKVLQFIIFAEIEADQLHIQNSSNMCDGLHEYEYV